MSDLARLLLLLALAGGLLTLGGGAAIWFSEESRRIRRGLKRVLRGAPQAIIIAPGRGRGAGFNFSTNTLAVTWDAGAWCLLYRIDELVGAELTVDGQVAARVHRGEARRALDAVGGAEELVRLRFLFEDAAHPDFTLDLWVATDKDRRGALSPREAIQEANRWIARIDALLARMPARRPPTPAPPPAVAPPPEPDDDPPFEPDEMEDDEPRDIGELDLFRDPEDRKP